MALSGASAAERLLTPSEGERPYRSLAPPLQMTLSGTTEAVLLAVAIGLIVGGLTVAEGDQARNLLILGVLDLLILGFALYRRRNVER